MPAGGQGNATGPEEPIGLILDYHPEASDELIAAAGFYENREDGLGHRFLDVVDASLARLQRNPCLAPMDEGGRRKYLIRGFPYVIIYRIERTFLHILAVAHTSRKPGYWISREASSG